MSDSMREWGQMTDEAIRDRNSRSKISSVTYQPEMWSVPKDAIYAAINAIQLALGYMPQIKTDVPQWQKAVEQDIVRIECALAELRKLGADSPR